MGKHMVSLCICTDISAFILLQRSKGATDECANAVGDARAG